MSIRRVPGINRSAWLLALLFGSSFVVTWWQVRPEADGQLAAALPFPGDHVATGPVRARQAQESSGAELLAEAPDTGEDFPPEDSMEQAAEEQALLVALGDEAAYD